MENALALINLLLILMAVLFIFLVILVIDTLQNRKVLVKRTSTKYAGMQELNDVFAFSPIKEKVYLHKDCNSKSQFDRQQEYDYLVSLTRDSPAWLEEIIYQAERNRILFEEYSERAAKLEPTSKEIIASLRTLMGSIATEDWKTRRVRRLCSTRS